MIAREHQPRAGAAAPGDANAPWVLERRILGTVRLAAMMLDGAGRVRHWNQAAAELFGVREAEALGRPPAAFLKLPRENRDALEPKTFRHVWCGSCTLPRTDTGEHAEVGWWIYPLDSPPPGEDGTGIVALAVDLRLLRADGAGLLIDGVTVAVPGVAAGRGGAMRVLRVEPTMTGVAPDESAPIARHLADLLPVDGPAATAITDRVLELGCPAITLTTTVRLPVVPYVGGVPKTLRARRRPGAVRPPLVPNPRPGQGLETMAVWEPLEFLGEAGEQIGSSLDHLQAARTLAEVLVPRIADFAAVELLESVVTDLEPPRGEFDGLTLMRRVAVVHNDDPGGWTDAVPEDETLRLPESTPFVRAMKSGRAVHIPRVGPEDGAEIAASFGDHDVRPLLTDRALLIQPLIARGNVLGTFKLLRKHDRPPFDDLELAMVDELARRAALCIDNGRLYRREVQVAQELQHRLLPDDPPHVPGARICYRYRPAGQAAQVGGDWFDALVLPGHRVGIVVGDVMGHGITSAAIMGQMRTAVRTLATQDLPPEELLRRLDILTRRLGEDNLATCMYAVYDAVGKTCTIANAGHVPPVLVSPLGESTVLPVPAGLPIGVGGEPFETVRIDVEDGSQLFLCTDGLLERRDRDVEAGLEAMRAQLAGASHDLDDTCDGLLAALANDVPADDIAIVAVGIDGIPKDDIARWDLTPTPSAVPRVRAQVAAQLTDWGLGIATDAVQLLVSELVTNALVHGAGVIRLRLIKTDTLLCQVYDDGQELPQLCHAGATDESGRGLHLVSAIAERWGSHGADHGKVVWFEYALP
ncbi:ATP-binding SpoIIE family protein phosphatase [Spirillospora albida]|uniref:ATP-binding SpoIIE family protein phosphatase n=1 Tax=Spirillospora albida TaxID=58123 RepID=UPI0012F9F0B0|nr:SpoIIE family protein phosphatase [Spirillospora albida]